MIKKYIQSLFIVLSLVLGGLLAPASQVTAQEATYSCGTYGGGSYSQNGCSGQTSNGTTTIKPPDTGFAKLMHPTNLLALLGFLAIIALGIGIIFKLRHQKQ